MIFGLSLYQILCLIGVPTLTSAIGVIHNKLKQNQEEINAVKLGLQALLRSQMIVDYNKWTERGYAPIYARDNFENCWQQYHSLGANGVMNDIHDKFMDLPTEKETNK